MPNVGYCHECGQWVYVLADWGCPAGHPASRVNGWYNSDSGQPLAPPPVRPASAPATRVPDLRERFLADLITTIAEYPAYTAARGADTDLTIASNPVDPMWATGDARAEYQAAVKVVEAQRAVYLWERLTERGSGLLLGETGCDLDTISSFGYADAERSVVGLAGSSQECGYGTTREIVRSVATRHGLTLKTVLRRSSALW